jgi:hypothetical protein
MPKYDAFGREIGEDTLASWREQETPVAQPAEEERAEPEPAVTADEATVTIGEPIVIQAEPVRPPPDAAGDAPPAAAPDPERVIRVQMPRSGRRRPRVVSRLILLLVVLGIAGTFAVNVGREIEDAIDDVPGFTPPAPEAAPPVGLQAGSLIRPGELRRALAELRSKQLGRVQSLRLAPERIDAALLSQDGALKSVQLRHDGDFQEFSSTPGLGHLEAIPWSRLNPAAPARLVRQAARRMNEPADQINYLVPSLIGGKVIWGAYFKGGQIFQGDARGRLFRRVS